MTTVYLKRTDPTVDAIVRAAFPSYNGQKVSACIAETARFSGTNWDEGSKSDYVVVDLATMKSQSIHQAPYFQGSPLHEADHAIPDGFVVVQHSHFRQLESVTIIGPAANVSPLLSAPVEITPDERTVLIATRTLKSSYGGVSNYRFSEARSHTGITLDRWNTAKDSLVARKLLNKAGAITTDGRNAIGRANF